MQDIEVIVLPVIWIIAIFLLFFILKLYSKKHPGKIDKNTKFYFGRRFFGLLLFLNMVFLVIPLVDELYQLIFIFIHFALVLIVSNRLYEKIKEEEKEEEEVQDE